MRICVYCKFRYKKGSTISFHKIPTDPSIRRIWLQKMKVCNWSPKDKDALCSKHFDVSCFVEHNNRRSLKPGRVPTIFEGNFDESGIEVKIESNSDDVIRGNEMDVKEPKTTISSYGYKYASHPSSTNGNIHSSSSPPSKQPPNRLHNVTNTEDSSTTTASNNDYKKDYKSLQTLKKSRIQYSVAHDHQYESTPRSYKNAVQHAKKSLQVSNARIKVLTQCVRRLRNKVTSLASVIHDLSKGDLRKMYEIDVESTL